MNSILNRQVTNAVIVAALVILPAISHSECVEYKIVEHEDSVEAVCVGKPLTAEEEKAKLAEEKKERLKAANEAIAAQKEAARVTEQLKVKESPRSADKEVAKSGKSKEKTRQRRSVNYIEEKTE